MRKFNSKDVVVLTGDETGTLNLYYYKISLILACRIIWDFAAVSIMDAIAKKFPRFTISVTCFIVTK